MSNGGEWTGTVDFAVEDGFESEHKILLGKNERGDAGPANRVSGAHRTVVAMRSGAKLLGKNQQNANLLKPLLPQTKNVATLALKTAQNNYLSKSYP